MKTLFDMLTLLGAAVLAACGLTVPRGESLSFGAAAVPFSCAIRAEAAGGMTQVQGVLTATAPIRGSYDLRVRQSGADIRQGGDFIALPGQEMVLGAAQLSGDAPDVSLRIVTEGQVVECPVM